LIQQMARENSLWGVERIRGELLKLGIRVASLPRAAACPGSAGRGPGGTTIQKYPGLLAIMDKDGLTG
jgi:hypothetical protein